MSREPKTKFVANPFPGSLLAIPNDGKPHPGIVLLHGSESGGFPAWKVSALRWTCEGFATLALSYFGNKDSFAGPRQTLAEIDVEHVVDALKWLKNSEFVQGKNIALDGTSRGGELALLTGSLIEDGIIDAISVHSPADQVWGSWNNDWIDYRCWLGDIPSYKELHTPSEKFIWNPKCGPDPRNLPENLQHSWKWKGVPLVENTPIAIEKIRCPVFLTQGLKDSIWPAEQSKRIEAILKAHNLPHEAIFYDNEDHWLGLDASFDRQRRLLNFYLQHLGV
jgi:dipeptidyl aminopeptidase/acylaminoacyl peptidase